MNFNTNFIIVKFLFSLNPMLVELIIYLPFKVHPRNLRNQIILSTQQSVKT